MNEQRKDILDMLAEGKVTAEEAEQLIAALERDQPPAASSLDARPKGKAKYLRLVWRPWRTTSRGGSTCGCRCNCCGPAYGWRPLSRRGHWNGPTPN